MVISLFGAGIVFIAFFIYSGDWLLSLAIATGPPAAFLLFSKEERKKESLSIPARDFIQKLISAIIVGILYTGAVYFILGLVGLMMPNFQILNSSLIIIAAHFIPHAIILLSKKKRF